MSPYSFLLVEVLLRENRTPCIFKTPSYYFPMRNLFILALLLAATLQPAAAQDLAPLPLVLPPPAMKGTPQSLPTNTTALPLTSELRPPFLAPKGGANISLGKPVTASDTNTASFDKSPTGKKRPTRKTS
jgi:hypothetical protein